MGVPRLGMDFFRTSAEPAGTQGTGSMWNPFRRKPARPKGPPIQNLDSIDVTGKRRDGGVDLVIVATQPLDDAPDTLNSIRHKVAYYLDVIDLPEFQADFDYPPRDRTTIIIDCDHPIHSQARAVIEECRAAATAAGVRLELRDRALKHGPASD